MSEFDRYRNKLSRNVYGSLKGEIRLKLIENDIRDFCKPFSKRVLSVLDVGCGEGAFAEKCLMAGHRVQLLDSSEEMLTAAVQRIREVSAAPLVQTECADFLAWQGAERQKYELVLMHGSAEWMRSASDAIARACKLVAPGGYLSLLMFNLDVYVFKKGINGHLLKNDPNRKQKLFPPEAQFVRDTVSCLAREDGEMLLQSGIRIFHGFFRQFDSPGVSAEQWMQQELAYYRLPPFSQLGQHTHFIWQRNHLP